MSQNEHYLPRGLGKFRGDMPLVDRICDACQSRFSQLEDVFLHNSSEAFFREMVQQLIGRVGRSAHREKNIFREPTMKLPPLTVIAPHPGTNFEVLWEPVRPGQMRVMPQIVAVDENETALRIPFRRGKLTKEGILELAGERELGRVTRVFMCADTAEDNDELTALCKALGWQGADQQVQPSGEGEKIEAEMRAFVSQPYVRAIAKVGFHFFLQYFGRYTGFEREFDDIKRFIYEGVSREPLVYPIREEFAVEFQRGARAKGWCHLLTAQSSEQGIEARIQFFAGPEVRPLVWRVVIGRNPSPIVYTEAIGYGYRYFQEVTDGFHGERIELPAVTRLWYPR